MKKSLIPLIVGCVVLLGVFYAWTHLNRVATSLAAPSPAAPSPAPSPAEGAKSAEAELANQMVTVAGPLAEQMLNQKPTVVETASPVVSKPAAADRVGNSPVGTSSSILQKTFAVTTTANQPFEVPACAANPKLRGTYHAFVRHGGTQSNDEAANVEFFLMNEEQYADLLSRHSTDALFSAEEAGQQEVDFTLPPTFDQPVKYYLVFRNGSTSTEKKLVQADFHIDF